MRGKRAWLRFTASAFVAVTGLWFLQCLLTPKYVDGVIEGAFIAEYYREKTPHDVIFIGDCEVYENFSPPVLWEDYGITSYIRGSAEQYIFQSYYLLKDTLRYETPRVVIFNVQAMQFSDAQSEAYNRMTLEGMAWSPAKVNAIFASMKEEERFLDYVFPILRYHTRWSELTASDVRYLFGGGTVSHNGYSMHVGVRPAEHVPEGRILADYAFGERAWFYLQQITALCEENDMELILIKAPSLYPYWYEEWDSQIREYARANNLRYINLLEYEKQTGIDYTTDTYDAGLHMNVAGAEKLSRYLGDVLSQDCGVPDRRGDAALRAVWEAKVSVYEREKQARYDGNGMGAPQAGKEKERGQ